MTLLDFIIDSVYFQVGFWVIIAVFGIFRIALAWWVYRDMIARTRDNKFQLISSVFVFLFGLFGLVFYVLFRPMQTLKEREIEELELTILRADLKSIRESRQKKS